MALCGTSGKSLMNPSATIFPVVKQGHWCMYQGDLMRPNPAHSTPSDQQSVDLHDYVEHEIGTKYL